MFSSPCVSLVLIRSRVLAAGLCAAAWLSACGGGGGGSSSVAGGLGDIRNGIFLDSAVQGLTFITPTLSGVTRADGGFDYRQGESVTFRYGAIEFPPAVAYATVTPVDMSETKSLTDPVVTNIAYLLQGLDADLNPNNGIQLPAALANRMPSLKPEDFAKPTAEFEAMPVIQTAIEDAALLRADPNARRTPAQATAHLHTTLQGLMDAAPIPDLGCDPNPIINQARRTDLNVNLWADEYIRPFNIDDWIAKGRSYPFPGWVYGNDFKVRMGATSGVMTRYQPDANAPEVQIAKKSMEWSNVYSLNNDVWLKHRNDTSVILRVAVRASAQESSTQPKYVGAALYLIYTGAPGRLLQFQFDERVEPQVFFSFIGSPTGLSYVGTGGKDGLVNTGDDGVLPVGLSQWDQHRPGDDNFPPNLRKGGTTPLGRQLSSRMCALKPMGSVLLWYNPTVQSDLIYSPSVKFNRWGVEAPMYSDELGYAASVGIRRGVKTLGILSP